jgi:hypothetical protein
MVPEDSVQRMLVVFFTSTERLFGSLARCNIQYGHRKADLLLRFVERRLIRDESGEFWLFSVVGRFMDLFIFDCFSPEGAEKKRFNPREHARNRGCYETFKIQYS